MLGELGAKAHRSKTLLYYVRRESHPEGEGLMEPETTKRRKASVLLVAAHSALLAERDALKAQLADLIGDVVEKSETAAERDALKAELASLGPAEIEWRARCPGAGELIFIRNEATARELMRPLFDACVQSRTVRGSEWIEVKDAG
jgi:hypothetical protein